MQNIFYERLLLIMKYLKITSLRSFAKKIGITFSKLQSYQRGSSPGLDVLNIILVNNPEISPEWLITGQGEMLKQQKEEMPKEINYVSRDLLEKALNQVNDLIEMNKTTQKHLDEVIQMCSKMLERKRKGQTTSVMKKMY